LKVEQPE